MTAPDSPDVVPPTPDPSEQLELKLPDESSAWRDLGLWAGVLVLLALVVYWPATGGRFQWLDDRAVSHNQLLAKPGGLGDVWADRWQAAGGYRFPAYQPVAFTADWIAYRLGGHDDQGRPTPTAYHAVALVCHAAAAVLAWLALRELAVPAAWLVAAVFAVHPVNAQAVSWISDGGVTVGGALFFGSAYAYLSYQRFRDRDAADRLAGGPGGDPAQTWGAYAAAAGLAILAVLAYPAAGVVPGVLMLALWWRRRLARADALLLAPVLAVTAVLWLANLSMPRPVQPGGVPPAAGLSVAGVVAAIGSGLQFAAVKAVVPFPLKLIYTAGLAGGLIGLALAVVVLGVLPALAYARTGRRGAVAAAAAFALCAIPALNWFDPARRGALTDSTAYLALVPLTALVLGVLVGPLRRVRSGEGHTQLVVIASAVLLVVLGATAWTRAHAFETPVSLWQDTADKAPASPFASVMLAEALRQRGAEDAAAQDADGAVLDYNAAVVAAAHAADLAAGDPAAAADAQRTWATALAVTDDQAALPHFALATAGGGDAPTLVQYGQSLLKLGHVPESIAVLNRALAADPASAPAHRVLGQAYHKAGNDARSLIEFQTAVQMNPSDYAAQQMLGERLAKAGRLKEALDRYVGLLTADKANQTRADLWAAVGRIKLAQGVDDEAVTYLSQAQQLDAQLPDIDRDLADARAKLKRDATTRPAMTRPASAPAGGGPAFGGPAGLTPGDPSPSTGRDPLTAP